MSENRSSTVRKRSDGTWEARYYVAGERRPRSVYGKQRKDALTKRKQILRDLDDGAKAGSLKTTVGEYLEAWITGSLPNRVAAGKLTQRSVDDYAYRARKYIVPKLGSRKLRDLTADDLDALYAYYGETLDSRSVLYIHQTIRAALTNAVKRRMIPYNVARDADAPSQPKAKSRNTLDAKQISDFLGAARETNDRFEAFFALSIFSGARPGELLALKWSDIRFGDETVGGPPDGEARIERSVSTMRKSRGGTSYILRETTKTGVGRSVYLFPEAVAYLKLHRKLYSEEKMRYRSIWEATWRERPELEGLVFPSKVGGIMCPQNLRSRHFLPLAKRAGLPKIRQYDLRHTFSTLWLESGENVKVLSEILGHSRISQTLDTYSHVLPHFQRASYQRFAKVFDRPADEA